MTRSRRPVLLGIFAAIVGVILFLPGLAVIPMGFNGARTMRFPPDTWGVDWYLNFFTNPAWTGSLVTSFAVSLLAAVLATVLGTLTAFALIRHRFPGKPIVTGLVLAPLVTPIVILGLGDYSLFLQWQLTGSLPGFVLAYTVIALPYAVITVSASLAGVERQYELAASVLGASKFSVFTKITLPLISRGMAAGFLFAFVTGFDETVIAIFLSDPGFRTLPVTMYSSMTREVDPTIAAASAVIMLTTTLILLAYVSLTKGPHASGNARRR
ncbi:MAG TPA: ABC transporter permease [Pseudolysinimonas sp.]|nr:ABC transporter permease [Pseudolysinimonas sp.]